MKKIIRTLILSMWIAFWVGPGNSLIAQSQPEAGFCFLEENDFYFHTNSYFNRLALRSSPSRIWRVYQPADSDPASKPLFVFFNGGPGGATSPGLFSANTGRNAVSVDPQTDEGSIIINPHSWTRIGNLLHIDSRTAGFSYSLMDNPQDDTLRQAEWDAHNYNCFIDGADFVRVLLRFLSDNPTIQKNPVVLVVESYGGIRSLVMLHLLLYYQDYANGKAIYQDPALVQEIQAHYNIVFPQYAGQAVPSSVIAEQFSHQVLIQPAITRYYQRMVAVEMLEVQGSILDELAEETDVPYVRYKDQPWAIENPTPYNIMNNIYDYLDNIDRDPYFYSKPEGYFNGYFDAAGELLTHYDALCLMTGVDVAGIPELYSSARQKAYKIKFLEDYSSQANFSALMGPAPKASDLSSFFSPCTEEDMTSIFGTLQPWDRYFLDLNYDVSTAFSLNMAVMQWYNIQYGYSERYGEMFLENVAFVETFITNAAYDIVVYCPSLPDALAFHASKLNRSTHDTDGPPQAERPGQILLEYKPGSVTGSSVTTRTIRFPLYTKSGHAVTMTEPGEILEDVIVWLEKTGFFAETQMRHAHDSHQGVINEESHIL
jgi:pimeloyl-ACP methyl ester carboxylesterase